MVKDASADTSTGMELSNALCNAGNVGRTGSSLTWRRTDADWNVRRMLVKFFVEDSVVVLADMRVSLENRSGQELAAQCLELWKMSHNLEAHQLCRQVQELQGAAARGDLERCGLLLRSVSTEAALVSSLLTQQGLKE